MVQPSTGTGATGRVLGIDLGSRRIGVAVSDAERKVASALALVLRGRSHLDDHARLGELVTDTGANLVVVGLPLSLSGAAGPAARAVQDEVAELRRALPVPVELSDERYSTVVATQVLSAQGRRGRDRRQLVDKVAAATILQTWLDRQGASPPSDRARAGSAQL
jgi:putative holliday junction resolvase